MNGVWSRPPAGRVMRLNDLGDLGEKVSEGNGESAYVCKLTSHPGWLYKAYRSSGPADSASRLDRLIGLPGQMSLADKSLVDARTSWPAARIVDSANRTTGVLVPLAPEEYKFEWTLPGGRSRHKFLDVDVLALSEMKQRQMGLPPQSLAERIAVCASIAAMADLLERHRLVYLDWSYANLFWRPADHSAYLIDLDGASFGPRPQIQSPQWEDPHFPLGTTAGNDSDRYRVALLITRCLTGTRVYVAEARTKLSELRTLSAEVEHLAELLILTLTTAASSRPTIATMRAALDVADGTSAAGQTVPLGGVREWKSVHDRGSTRANPPVTAPRVTTPPRRATTPAPPKPAPAAASTTGFPPQPPSVTASGDAVRSSSAINGTGRTVQRASSPQSPVTPSSSASGVAMMVMLTLIVIVIVIVILAIL